MSQLRSSYEERLNKEWMDTRRQIIEEWGPGAWAPSVSMPISTAPQATEMMMTTVGQQPIRDGRATRYLEAVVNYVICGATQPSILVNSFSQSLQRDESVCVR